MLLSCCSFPTCISPPAGSSGAIEQARMTTPTFFFQPRPSLLLHSRDTAQNPSRDNLRHQENGQEELSGMSLMAHCLQLASITILTCFARTGQQEPPWRRRWWSRRRSQRLARLPGPGQGERQPPEVLRWSSRSSRRGEGPVLGCSEARAAQQLPLLRLQRVRPRAEELYQGYSS